MAPWTLLIRQRELRKAVEVPLRASLPCWTHLRVVQGVMV